MDNDRHKQRQQKLKQRVDERIAAANEVRRILMVFTGNGKGKNHGGVWHRNTRGGTRPARWRNSIYQG